MSERGMQIVLERWTEDEAFRGDLRSNPDSAVSRVGAELDPKEMEYLRGIDWTLSDEELQSLLEKSFYGRWC
jgi:hypothetical protein